MASSAPCSKTEINLCPHCRPAFVARIITRLGCVDDQTATFERDQKDGHVTPSRAVRRWIPAENGRQEFLLAAALRSRSQGGSKWFAENADNGHRRRNAHLRTRSDDCPRGAGVERYSAPDRLLWLHGGVARQHLTGSNGPPRPSLRADDPKAVRWIAHIGIVSIATRRSQVARIVHP